MNRCLCTALKNKQFKCLFTSWNVQKTFKWHCSLPTTSYILKQQHLGDLKPFWWLNRTKKARMFLSHPKKHGLRCVMCFNIRLSDAACLSPCQKYWILTEVRTACPLQRRKKKKKWRERNLCQASLVFLRSPPLSSLKPFIIRAGLPRAGYENSLWETHIVCLACVNNNSDTAVLPINVPSVYPPLPSVRPSVCPGEKNSWPF